MAIKVRINDEEVEVTPDQITMPEGYAMITPDSIPKGYFTQEALNKTISDRLERDREKTREKLLQDSDFKKTILSEYNIALDEEGKPKGLKPEFDTEEWKRNNVKQLTEPLQKQLEEKESKLNSFKKGLIRAEIMKSASNLFQEQYLTSFTGEDDPFIVKQFADSFDVDETGNVLLRDKEGGFAMDNQGNYFDPAKFFKSNETKFAPLMKDNRQRGAGLNPGGSGGTRFTEEQVKSMSDEDYAKHREDILKSM
jgi:hypothetical protein